MANDCDCKCSPRAWVPSQTTVLVNADNSLQINPRPGFVYVGFDSGGNLLRAIGGTKVSCDCVGTGSCLPVIVINGLCGGADVGCTCVCTDCKMKSSAIIGGAVVNFTEIFGYINLADCVKFADPKLKIPTAFDAMFELPEVKSQLEKFVQ